MPRGAVYGLVGPNGAGKTTLLRHLTGVYHQDSGSVTFDGQPVWENADVKARIASIPDDWFYFMQTVLTCVFPVLTCWSTSTRTKAS